MVLCLFLDSPEHLYEPVVCTKILLVAVPTLFLGTDSSVNTDGYLAVPLLFLSHWPSSATGRAGSAPPPCLSVQIKVDMCCSSVGIFIAVAIRGLCMYRA